MLRTLLSPGPQPVQAALDNPTALVQAAVVRQGQGLLRRAGFERRLASLQQRSSELEKKTLAKLSSDAHKASLGGFGSALDQSVRKALRSEALRSTSRFLTRTWRGLARNLFIKPTELVKNIDELEFLKKQARPPS